MKKTFILFFALLASTIVCGQEFIKQISVKQDTSIVREVAYQTWLVYAYNPAPPGVSTFAMVTETGTTAPLLELPADYHVCDFEIYDDTVFFCGYTTSSPLVAIFGYFDLASFPASTVRCCHVAGMRSINKMAIFNNNNNPHVVYTGVMAENYQSVVGDALRNSANSWDFQMSYCTNLIETTDLVYDDVAVIEDYIIATSRVPFYLKGYIFYINIPTTYVSMFPDHTWYRTVQYTVVSPILVTACDGNYYATLCKNGSGVFTMSRYNCFNDDVSLQSSVYDLSCRDINYNSTSKNIEVLLNYGGVKYDASMAIHYEQTITGSTLVPFHDYQDEQLFSIDYLTNHADCFIATGHLNRDYLQDELRIYRYKYDEWHDCTIEGSLKAREIDNYHSSYSFDYYPMTTSQDAMPIECGYELEAEINTICEY